MRSRHKEWQDGRGGKWTCRIIWYEEGDGENIRLHLETPDGIQYLYPKTVDEAQGIWDKFKVDHPKLVEPKRRKSR